MKGASIKVKGASLHKQPYSKVPNGNSIKGATVNGNSKRSGHSAGFHCGYGKGSVKGSHK